MIEALGFFFITVFGEGEHAWTIRGPFSDLESCQRRASGANFGMYGAPSSTSQCYPGPIADGATIRG
jgi:hypothetical protein